MENQIGFFRLKQIIGDPKAKPPIPPLIPVSRSTWLNGCREGKFPCGVLLTPRTRAWPKTDIFKLAEKLAGRDNESGT